jgi:hypothetical protein
MQESELLSILSSEQAEKLNLIARHVSDLVMSWSGGAAFWTYTDHYMGHVENLIQILNHLTSEDAARHFNSMEVFVLYCAIYLHDIGLLSVDARQMEIESVRREHHLLSRRYIQSNFRLLALTAQEAELVATVCGAHKSPNLAHVAETLAAGPWKIRLRFLAALLRLLDVLDIDHSRTPPLFQLTSDPYPQLKEIWRVNRAVSGIQFRPQDATVILRVAPVIDEEPDSLLVLVRQRADEISRCLSSISDQLEPNGVVYRKVEIMLEPQLEFPRCDSGTEVGNV